MQADLSIAGGRFDNDLGMWYRVPGGRPRVPVPALFLDRDGVIVEDPGYLCRSSDMLMIPGAAELIASANRAGIPVIETTNQAGIARGYYGWTEFAEVETAISECLMAAGAIIDAAFACPYHHEGIAPWAHPAHPARKPRPGMLLAAARMLRLDLSASWIVGDMHSDLLAGKAAGLRGGFHVLTGHGTKQRPRVMDWHPASFHLRMGQSIGDALPLIELLKPAARNP